MTKGSVPRFRAALGGSKTPVQAAVTPKSDGTSATLRLYDVIDSWGGQFGISAKEVAEALDNLGSDVTTITLLVNSPGGESSEGIAILNLLRQHPAQVQVVVEGLAASAASFIAMAGDEIVMAPNSQMMVHDAWGLTVGNAADMQAMTDLLNKISDNIASIYQSRAGGTLDEWRTVMQAETWYSATEAVTAGLADRVLDLKPESEPATQNEWDLSVFTYAGRHEAPTPPLAAGHARRIKESTRSHPEDLVDALNALTSAAHPETPVTPSASGSTPTAKENEMSLSDALRERLGIADEDATEDTILAALDEALAEQADPPKDKEELNPVALAEISRLSNELAELKKTNAQREKNDLFASWLRDGKTSPAEIKAGKDDGLDAMYDAAPEQTKALINARAKGTVVPVALVGSDDSGEDLESSEFNALFGPEEVSA